ncbi:hypothetical protein TSUD_206780 [Trifolium subterraneum]|uniref:Uncharacterized protein n=1 Tax=Trifolium subterraneum TaxID=3900 RepID=A0A2Z6NLF2_TRISU|nr:hypothetical protein TSUD_206780 [Trifolium subterraneum]
MAGIASGICNLAVGTGNARRRSTQAQSGPNGNTSPPDPTPLTEEFAYSNAGKQNIKGLTNQTGYVKGNANGVINFGTLTSSSSAQRQP